MRLTWAGGCSIGKRKRELAVASFWRITIATFLALIVLYKIFDSKGADRCIHDDEMSGFRLHYVDDAVCLYAGQHDDRLPDNLKVAVSALGFDSDVNQCPPSRTHGAKLQNPAGFMYLGAGWHIKDMANEQIIACEPFSASAADKNERIVILRADNHVESIAISDVEKRIRAAAIRLNKNQKTAASHP